MTDSPNTPGTITFRPVQTDMEAINGMKRLHPFLLTTSDVLRYCLHMLYIQETTKSKLSFTLTRSEMLDVILEFLVDEMPVDESEIDALPPNPLREKVKARLDVLNAQAKNKKKG